MALSGGGGGGGGVRGSACHGHLPKHFSPFGEAPPQRLGDGRRRVLDNGCDLVGRARSHVAFIGLT